jgi:catechol 2,3-dioxygenase-like lactoylglutathione lyase family enzyme
MPTNTTPSVQSIDHIHVYVPDRVAAERWYARVLGLTRIAKFEFWAEGGGPLTIQNREGTVHIALFERVAQACRSTIALAVGAQDFLVWKAHLARELGHEAKVEDHDLAMSLYFNDPFGNPYEITTYEHEVARLGLK